jgi:hypothetical protein
MTQPKFAPIPLDDEARPAAKLDVPRPWTPHRPGEFIPSSTGRQLGQASAGPDQGYASLLAQRFVDKLVLAPGEHQDDSIAAGVAVALRRAALFGRAPIAADIEVGLAAFGLLKQPDAELVAFRSTAIAGIAHDGWRRRELADLVPESVLRLTPSQATSTEPWRALAKA